MRPIAVDEYTSTRSGETCIISIAANIIRNCNRQSRWIHILETKFRPGTQTQGRLEAIHFRTSTLLAMGLRYIDEGCGDIAAAVEAEVKPAGAGIISAVN